MSLSKLTKRLSVVIPVAVAPVLLAAGSAFAVSVPEGDDYAYNEGLTLYACDMEQDGNGVYAEYWGDGTTHGTVSDGNGSAGGCGSAKLPSLKSFKVCERHWYGDSCSSVVSV